MSSEKHRQFFEELWGLCKKHGASIDGCGCCGSPWVGFDVPAEGSDPMYRQLGVNEDGLEAYPERIDVGITRILLGAYTSEE